MCYEILQFHWKSCQFVLLAQPWFCISRYNPKEDFVRQSTNGSPKRGQLKKSKSCLKQEFHNEVDPSTRQSTNALSKQNSVRMSSNDADLRSHQGQESTTLPLDKNDNGNVRPSSKSVTRSKSAGNISEKGKKSGGVHVSKAANVAELNQKDHHETNAGTSNKIAKLGNFILGVNKLLPT